MRRLDSTVREATIATPADIDELNRVFSEAFTDRYHRDGMRSVRVPLLNPAVWRYAFAVAGDGALVWRDPDGSISAFNMIHLSGAEGWMGPLAVRPDRQRQGLGRTMVTEGIARLQQGGAKVIGLETMPRTVDNIGFYSLLGFRPGHLTISMGREVGPDDAGPATPTASQPAGVRPYHDLTEAVGGVADYRREIALTRRLALGDVTSVVDGAGRLAAFALWHNVALADTRSEAELRVLKVVARDLAVFRTLLDRLIATASVQGLTRVGVRCQTRFTGAYAELLAAGFRVHWTDLRMTLAGFEEQTPTSGVVLSNWEI